MAATQPPKFAGKPAFNRLRKHLLIPESNRDVEWEHGLGLLVDELCPRDKRVYGEGSIQTLADELGSELTSANKLWNARKLGVAIPPRELASLQRKAKQAAFELSASHILALVTVLDPAERVALGYRCIEQKLGVKHLRYEIHRVQGKRSGGGAKVLKPASVEEALQDLVDRSKAWLSRHEQAWFADEPGSLSRPLPKATKDRLAGKLDESLAVLLELRQAADAARRRLSELRAGTD